MSKGGLVTVDAERYLALLNRLRDLEAGLRDLGQGGFVSKATEKKDEREAMPLDIDISGIDWKRSKKQGGGAAGPNDDWSWAFSHTRDGFLRTAAAPLVSALEQYGKVLVDGFEISLAGRDGKLLNRKKVK